MPAPLGWRQCIWFQKLPHQGPAARANAAVHAYRTKAGELSEEEQNQFMALFIRKEAYIAAAPDAGKIDRIIQYIYREEYSQAISQLARLRQEHPDYCPQAFAELSAALTTPNRLKLLLLCTRLPLGVIRETHIMK